jgi:hypothetical protein
MPQDALGRNSGVQIHLVDTKSMQPRIRYLRRLACFAAGALVIALAMTATAQSVSTYLGAIGQPGGPTAGTGSAARLIQPTLMLPDGANQILLYDASARTIFSVARGNSYGTLNPVPIASGVTVSGWAIDANNDILVADATAHVVRRLTRSGGATIIAGVSGSPGSQDGPATTLGRLNQPSGVVALANGDILIADTANHLIRRLSAGQLSTYIGHAGQAGSTDGTLWAMGTPGTARLNNPSHFVADATGTIYWVDNSSTIRSLANAATATDTTTVASNLVVNSAILLQGANTFLFASGQTAARLPIGGTPAVIAGVPGTAGSLNGLLTVARLNSPTTVLPGPANSYIIADTGNNALRRVGASLGAGPTFTTGLTNITLEVGNPISLSVAVASTGTTLLTWLRAGTVVQFGTSPSLAVTSDAILSDTTFYSVTATDDLGSISSGPVQVRVTANDPLFNFSTVVDSSRIPSALNSFVLGPGGWIYFAEPTRHVVCRINTTNGIFESLAGFSGLSGTLDGLRSAARFNGPHSVALDTNGNIYVSDFGNHTIRRISTTGNVTTLSGAPQVSGFVDGLPVNSRYDGPTYWVNDPTGLLLVLDGNLQDAASRVRTVDLSGNSGTRSGSPFGYGIRAFCTNSIGELRFVGHELSRPSFAYQQHTQVKAPGNSSIIAGNFSGFRDGTTINAQFGSSAGVITLPPPIFSAYRFTSGPRCMLYDPFAGSENYLILDTLNHALRRLRSTNVVTTVAGGTQGYQDGLSPLFDTPIWGQLDAAGNLWLLDGGGRRIRKGIRTQRLQITIPPTPLDIKLTGSGTLSVTANGASTLSYQWRKDGQDIPAATSSTYTISPAAMTDTGNYSVVVANTFATVETAAVAVRVLRPPSILAQPQTISLQEIAPGVYGAASFIVLADGDGTLTYQWTKDNSPIAGATQPQYDVLYPLPSDQGTYRVMVQNSVASAVSDGALLTLLIPPAITVQPVGRTNFAGSNVTFSVTVTGTPPFSFQWARNGSNLPSGTLNPLVVNALTVLDAGLYSVTVSNAAGVAVSSNALLSVRSMPVILSQSGARIIGAAQPAVFSVLAAGDAPFTYQWRLNGTNIVGATGATFSISAATPSHEGLYSVVVSNALGSATSGAARLTVLPVSVVVPWAAGNGGPGSDVGHAIAVDAAGNSYVAGHFTGTATFGTNTLVSAGNTDIFIAKHNSNAQLLWVRRAGGPGYDAAKGIAMDAAGNCYVTGAYEGVADFSLNNSLTNTSVASYSDVFLAKFDAAGTLVWVRSTGVEFANDEGTAVAVDAAGNVLVTGRSVLDTFAGGPVANAGRIFVAKYDSAGAEVWARKAGSYNGGNLDTGAGIATDGAGNVLVGGVFYSPVAAFGASSFTNLGNADVFLAKFDAAGTLLWARQAGGTGEDTASGVAVAADGSAYLVGALGGNANFSGSNVTSLAGAASDGFVAKFAPGGAVTWVRQLGGSGLSAARAVAVDTAGTVHVTGYFSGRAAFGTNTLGGISGSYDAFLTRLDPNGVFAFAQQAGGPDLSGDFGLGVGADAAGNSFITGYFSGTSSIGGGSLPSRGGEDVLVTRFNQFTGGGQPQLGLLRNGAQFRMRWPLASSSYVLQSTTNLLAPVWRDETNALTLNGTELETDVTPGSALKFYRLRKP